MIKREKAPPEGAIILFRSTKRSPHVHSMNNVLVGVILIAGIAFLGFLVTIVVLAIVGKKPGQSFSEAGKEVVTSGWRSLTSGFNPATDRRSGYDHPQSKPFGEMKQRSPESRYYGQKVPRPKINPLSMAMGYRNRPALSAEISSYERPGQPIVFPDAAVQPKAETDLNVPGADAYEDFASDALGEDIDAMSGRNLYGERQLPSSPLTDDQFRYVGDFEVKRGDPLLSSALTKTDIGFSNRGSSLFS